MALGPVFDERLPLITFFPAIFVAAWFGGFWPGIVSTVMSVGCAVYFFFAPAGSWTISRAADLLALALFSSVGVMISLLNETFHRSRDEERVARDRAERAQRDA